MTGVVSQEIKKEIISDLEQGNISQAKQLARLIKPIKTPERKAAEDRGATILKELRARMPRSKK